ncbi:hypothetical protein WME73_35750 [Sorangium sp. So ce302]|uniref:hypothetical protein n=1 Tax=Sorangium sp. So ce302 TaxID=3133297 RepID=UPI003F5FB5C2
MRPELRCPRLGLRLQRVGGGERLGVRAARVGEEAIGLPSSAAGELRRSRLRVRPELRCPRLGLRLQRVGSGERLGARVARVGEKALGLPSGAADELRRSGLRVRPELCCPRLGLRSYSGCGGFGVDDRLIAAEALKLLLQARDVLAKTSVRIERPLELAAYLLA